MQQRPGAPALAAERPWFESAFDAGYLSVYPHRDLPSARMEVGGLVRSGVGGRVLDLGCGFGRHTLALRELGVEVFGMDLSAELLAHAAKFEAGVRQAGQLASPASLTGKLVRGDFRSLPFRDESFDVVLMLFSSFGYFDDATNAALLAQIRRLLKPRGVLVLDLMNAERIRRRLVPRSVSECAGQTLHEERRLLEGGKRVRKDVRLSVPGQADRTWHEDVRLFDPPELNQLLASYGLRLYRVDGDFDASKADLEAPRHIYWATRS